MSYARLAIYERTFVCVREIYSQKEIHSDFLTSTRLLALVIVLPRTENAFFGRIFRSARSILSALLCGKRPLIGGEKVVKGGQVREVRVENVVRLRCHCATELIR